MKILNRMALTALFALLALASPNGAFSADKTVIDTTKSPQPPVKLHDNGDGSYSQTIYCSGGCLAAGNTVVDIDQTTPGVTNNVTSQGVSATGATISGNPVPVAGVTSGNLIEPLSVDAQGHLNTQGTLTSGTSTATGNLMGIAGYDGTHNQEIHTDTSGNAIVVANDASLVAGSPFSISGNGVVIDTGTFSSGPAPTMGYSGITVDFNSIGGGGQISCNGTNDTTTAAASVTDLDQLQGSSTSSTTTESGFVTIFTTAGYRTPIQGYPRIICKISSYVSGTITGSARYSKDAPPSRTIIGPTGGIGVAALSTSGGLSSYRWATGASGVIKGSIGRLYTWFCFNSNAATRYLQFYNKATAGVPGTDTPVLTVTIAATSPSPSVGAGDIGYSMSTGISWAITTDYAGTTAGASGDITCSGGYN